MNSTGGRVGVTVITNHVNTALEAQRARAKAVVGRFATDALCQVYAAKLLLVPTA